MKIKNKKQGFYFIGVFLLLVMILIPIAASAQKVFYPEPKIRPDIPETAIWDSSLGMYISDDYIKDSHGGYVLNEEKMNAFDPENVFSPEEAWLSTHYDSSDPIDMAIFRSVELIMQEPPTLLSSIDARDSVSIRKAIEKLDYSLLPKLWERTCEEPAFRAQKLVAMENLLSLQIDVGLYDKNAQKQWFDTFNFLRKELLNNTTSIDGNSFRKYGVLILPILVDDYQRNSTGQNILHQIIPKIAGNTIYGEDFDDTSLTEADTKKKVDQWLLDNYATIKAISSVLYSDYLWVE